MEDTQGSLHNLRLTLRSHDSTNKYPAKQHAQRVSAHLKSSKSIILLQGEKSSFYSNSENPLPFRQDRYFYYLTGCNEAGCYCTYETEDDKLTLWIPRPEFSFYDGRSSTVEEAMERYDVDEAKYITGKRPKISNLATWIRRHYDAGNDVFYLRGKSEVVPKPLRMQMLKDRNTPSRELREALDSCRAVKDHHEIDLIRKANAISAEAHTAIMKSLHRLNSEPEVEGIFVGTCIAAKAREQSYTPICASGENAAQLHYVDNDQDFDDRGVLLVDAGAEWQDYASDVTRTLPLNPSAPGYWRSKEAEAVYNAVAKIQERCISEVKPGKHFIDIHWLSIHMTLDALLSLGIVKGERKEVFEAGVVLAFYPHGLGHHVGLEVHDVQPPWKRKGDKARLRRRKSDGAFKDLHSAYERFTSLHPDFGSTPHITLTSNPQNFSLDPTQCFTPCTPASPALEAGNVITIEPGIYFNKTILDYVLQNEDFAKFVDLEVLEKYMHIGGVRIEDDVLITRDGYENLTTAPKGKEMLKIIRDGAKSKA